MGVFNVYKEKQMERVKYIKITYVDSWIESVRCDGCATSISCGWEVCYQDENERELSLGIMCDGCLDEKG